MSFLISNRSRSWLFGLFIHKFKWWSQVLRGHPSRAELTTIYHALVQPLIRNKANNFSELYASRFLEPWLESMAFSKGPLQDALPSMTFPAIEFLESLLSKSARVYEYGAGGSTIFSE